MDQPTQISLRRRCLTLLPGLLLLLLVACSQPGEPTPPEQPALPEQPAPPEAPEVWEPLFGASGLSEWYAWFPNSGQSDLNGIFKLENGLLHVMDVPENIENLEEGFLASRETYSSYHLRFEYMWGEKRIGDAAAPRGGGLLYHAVGSDKIWPRSLEFQIQEGDTGDLWLIDRTTAETTITSLTGMPQYSEGGQPYTTTPAPFTRLQKSETADTATGWNAVELIVSEDEIVHKVNGVLNNRVTNPQGPDGALTAGRIVFQAQNSEIMFRNVEIRQLP